MVFLLFFLNDTGKPVTVFQPHICAKHLPPLTPTPPSKPPGCTVYSSVCVCVFARVCVTPLHSEGQCSLCQLPHKGSFQVSPGRTLPPSDYLKPPRPPHRHKFLARLQQKRCPPSPLAITPTAIASNNNAGPDPSREIRGGDG